MTFTFAAQVAWDPIGKQAVKNASFQVYATSDTAYTTPLAITDPFGVALAGNILNSGSQGVFPQFNQATNAAVVITDPAHTYAWTINCVPTDAATANFISTGGSATNNALASTYTPKWLANTAYTVNQIITNPTGDLVRCTTAHTATSTYDSTKFQINATDPTGATQSALASTYATQAVGNPAWAASTAYTVGQIIRNPSGHPVTVTTAHTSTSTYDSTKFSTPLGYMPYAGTQTITTIKPTGDGRPGVWELIHNDTAGYIFHLMCGTGMGAGQALIGMGIDNGGVGLFVNNKLTGLGIKIDQNNTITSSTAFGLQINQMSAVAPAVQIQTVSGATTAIQWFASSSAAGQKFLSFVAGGTEKGVFLADTGRISWIADIETHDGGMHRARGLNTNAQDNQVKVKNTEVQLSSYTGSTDQYWHKRISHGGQSIKIETADTLAGGVDAAPTYVTGVEVKNVSGATQIGLYGATPVPRAAAIATPTSDTVGTKAAIDAIRAALTGIGITL